MRAADLRRHRCLVLETRQLRTRLQVLEGSIYSPKGQRFTSTPHATSRTGSTMDEVVARHIELEEFYRLRVAEGEAQELRVAQAISALEEPAERFILTARYIEGRSWAYICRSLAADGYSERTVYRLHGFALRHVEEVCI